MRAEQLASLILERYPSRQIPRGAATKIQLETGVSWSTMRKALVELDRGLHLGGTESLVREIESWKAKCSLLEAELSEVRESCRQAVESADARAEERLRGDREFLFAQLAQSKNLVLHEHIKQPDVEEPVYERSR